MARVISDKETTMETWKAIATMRVGDEHVKENSAQELRQEFELATFKDGETVEDFALCLMGMQASQQTLGVVLEDKQPVFKILHSAPTRSSRWWLPSALSWTSTRSRWLKRQGG
jgi:hypothetical protein